MGVDFKELPLPDELPAIPAGWRYESLGDLVEERGVSYGIVQPGTESADGVPIVRVNNIRNGRVDTADMLKVGADVEAKFLRSRLRGGEVLLTLVGTLGEVAIVPEELRGWNVARAVGVIPVRKDPGSLWVSICLRSAFIQHCIRTWATTTVQATFNLRDLAKLPIPIPPAETREAIAAVLGALDDKIELNRRMNATLEAMAMALFQSWFVDFDPVRAKLDNRFPAFLDPATAALFPATFQDSSVGHIPTGWIAIPLYDTAQWVNGAAFKSEDFCATGDGLPVIKIAELKEGIGPQTKWCRRDTGEDKIIDTGDLLYSWSGSPDTSLEAFLWSGGRGLLNQHIFKVISSTAAEKRFVYYLLQYLRPVLVETARNKQTTGLGHVTIADMKRMLVCMPSKEVLAAFDRNIAPIFDKAFTNTLESRTLAILRDTLLPKLLSGELKVTKVDSLETRVIPYPVQTSTETPGKTTDEFVEAIVISQLVRKLATPQYPLGRKRYNKLAYLAHRKAEDDVTRHYLKKAAGPYSPWAKYGGPEKIAQKNGYVKQAKAEAFEGLISGDNIDEIDRYVLHYPVCAAIDWVIGKFRYRKNDDLELLATVDFACLDLLREGETISRDAIKRVIGANKEWAPKLKREIFSDENIERALGDLRVFFPASFKS